MTIKWAKTNYQRIVKKEEQNHFNGLEIGILKLYKNKNLKITNKFVCLSLFLIVADLKQIEFKQ